MIASSTCVLPLFDYPIGLRPENHSASGEPFCVQYLLSPWLRLVHTGGLDPCPHAPNKRLYTQDARLRYIHLDRRTHREPSVCPSITFFFCCCLDQYNDQHYCTLIVAAGPTSCLVFSCRGHYSFTLSDRVGLYPSFIYLRGASTMVFLYIPVYVSRI